MATKKITFGGIEYLIDMVEDDEDDIKTADTAVYKIVVPFTGEVLYEGPSRKQANTIGANYVKSTNCSVNFTVNGFKMDISFSD